MQYIIYQIKNKDNNNRMSHEIECLVSVQS